MQNLTTITAICAEVNIARETLRWRIKKANLQPVMQQHGTRYYDYVLLSTLAGKEHYSKSLPVKGLASVSEIANRLNCDADSIRNRIATTGLQYKSLGFNNVRLYDEVELLKLVAANPVKSYPKNRKSRQMVQPKIVGLDNNLALSFLRGKL